MIKHWNNCLDFMFSFKLADSEVQKTGKIDVFVFNFSCKFRLRVCH